MYKVGLHITAWLILIWIVLEIVACNMLLEDVAPLALPNDQLLPFDSDTLWTLAPNSTFERAGISYSTNEHGLRTSEVPVATETVLFVGDSSTFGFGVAQSETLPEQTAHCSTFSPLNAGISGFSTLQISRRLPTLLHQFQPSWVVLLIPWSDVMTSEVSDTQRLKYAKRVVSLLNWLESPVVRTSYVARWLVQRAHLRMQNNPIELEPTSILSPYDKGNIFRVPPNEHLTNITYLYELTQRSGANFLLVFLPVNRQYPTPDPFTLKSYRLPVLEWSQQNGIPLIDAEYLYQNLETHQKKGWFVDEVHLSARGNRYMATEVCAALSAQ